MTQDEIIRMAREAGCYEKYEVCYFVQEDLERFAALVAAHERNRLAWTQEHWTEYEHAIVAAEREACAKVCKDLANSQFKSGETETSGALDYCAAAIRARSQNG